MARQTDTLSPTGLSPPSCDDRLLWDLFTIPFICPTVTVAEELGVFALLAPAGASAADVADKLALWPRGSEALLAVLAALGFLKQYGGRFHLTDTARSFLLPGGPFYWGGMLHFHRHTGLSHDSLKKALLQDTPGASAGTHAWEAEAADPAQIELLTHAMHAHSFPAAMAVAVYGDFAGVKKVLDVAGGSGCYCIALGSRYPGMRFTVLELPVVCPLVDSYAERYGLASRITALPGNMFEDEWPGGHDLHFFGNVFHDWSDETCRQLAAKSFDALPRGGRVCLHEALLNDAKDGPLHAALLSMAMAHYTRGKQRTATELAAILSTVAFTEIGVTPAHGPYALVTARKP